MIFQKNMPMRRLLPLVLVAGALLLVWSAPARAQVTAQPASLTVSLPQEEVAERTLTLTNGGTEPVAFCLSFDRSLQRSGVHSARGGGACGEPGELLYTEVGIGWDPYGLTMTPDGRLFAATYAYGRTYELTPGLDVVRSFTHPRVAELSAFAQTVGVAYNADTGTLWWTNAESSGTTLHRVMLLEGDLDGVPTGRRVVLPLVPGPPPTHISTPVGASYDPATGLFYYVDGSNHTVWAIDTLGVVPPGYPVEQTAYPGVPISNGVDAHGGAEGGVGGVRLELAVALPGGGLWDRVVVLDRWGNDLGGPETPLPDFQGGTGGGGMRGSVLRSRVDPNGVMYAAFSNFDTRGVAAVRPAPLAPSWLALSEWSGTLGPGESAEVGLTFSAGERAVGDYTAVLQVIEAASGAMTEVPLALSVTQGTAVEPGPEGEPPSLTVYPNPSRGHVEAALVLPEAGVAEVALYDVLGRRVAVLHEGSLVPGSHTFRLDTSALPVGVYVVRVAAGREVVSQQLTVVR